MIRKETKYQYWHRIDKINPTCKTKAKVGNCIEYKHKKEGRWEMFDFKTGDFTWSYEVTYLCRTLRNIPDKAKIKILTEKLNAKH